MKIVSRVVLALGFMSLIGCAGVTAKKDTPMANYTKLIVRPINFNDTVTDKIDKDEFVEYKALWASLGEKFNAELDKNIKEIGYFDQVSFSADSVADRDSIILETKIASLDPGIRFVMPGNAFYLGTLRTSEGKIIGKYSAKRTVGRPLFTTFAGAIETLITELGKDAGAKIGEAKL